LNRAYWVVSAAYAVALIIAIITYRAGFMSDLVLDLLLADLAATGVIFIFSFAVRNSSLYDPYWSLAPMVLWCFLLVQSEPLSTRLVLCGAVIMVWGARLTWNWTRTWRDLTEEDWRYRQLQSDSGRAYWLVSLFGIHLFPTILVFLGCMGLIRAAEAGETPLNMLDLAGIIIGASSIWIEARADSALHQFRANRTHREEHLQESVWRWCRHPNYLGEIGVWVAVGCFGLAAVGWETLVIAGPLAMILLFTLITIPMIEKKLAADKPGYAEYQRQTPMLLPYGRLKN